MGVQLLNHLMSAMWLAFSDELVKIAKSPASTKGWNSKHDTEMPTKHRSWTDPKKYADELDTTGKVLAGAAASHVGVNSTAKYLRRASTDPNSAVGRIYRTSQARQFADSYKRGRSGKGRSLSGKLVEVFGGPELQSGNRMGHAMGEASKKTLGSAQAHTKAVTDLRKRLRKTRTAVHNNADFQTVRDGMARVSGKYTKGRGESEWDRSTGKITKPIKSKGNAVAAKLGLTPDKANRLRSVATNAAHLGSLAVNPGVAIHGAVNRGRMALAASDAGKGLQIGSMMGGSREGIKAHKESMLPGRKKAPAPTRAARFKRGLKRAGMDYGISPIVGDTRDAWRGLGQLASTPKGRKPVALLGAASRHWMPESSNLGKARDGMTKTLNTPLPSSSGKFLRKILRK